MALLQKQLQQSSVQLSSSKRTQARVAVRAAPRQADSLQLAVSVPRRACRTCWESGPYPTPLCATSPGALRAGLPLRV